MQKQHPSFFHNTLQQQHTSNLKNMRIEDIAPEIIEDLYVSEVLAALEHCFSVVANAAPAEQQLIHILTAAAAQGGGDYNGYQPVIVSSGGDRNRRSNSEQILVQEDECSDDNVVELIVSQDYSDDNRYDLSLSNNND